MRAGARVWFVKRLHAKFFWSERGGCLIGSPNLSTNALGDDGLFETAMFVSGVEIDKVLKKMRQHAEPIRVDEKQLELLRQSHRRAKGRVKPAQTGAHKATESFAAWVTNPFRESFSVAFWEEPDTSGLTVAEKRTLIEEFDTDDFHRSLRFADAVKPFPENENILVLNLTTRNGSKRSELLMREERRFVTRAGQGGTGTRTKIIQVHKHNDPEPFKPSGKLLAAVMNQYFTDVDQDEEQGASFTIGSRNMKRLLKIAEGAINP